MIPGTPSPLMTLEEAAVYLGCVTRTIKRLIAEDELISLKIGKRRMVLVTSLDALIARRAA